MSVYINYRKSISHRNQTMTLDAYAAWPAVVFAAPSDDTQIAGSSVTSNGGPQPIECLGIMKQSGVLNY